MLHGAGCPDVDKSEDELAAAGGLGNRIVARVSGCGARCRL